MSHVLGAAEISQRLLLLSGIFGTRSMAHTGEALGKPSFLIL